MTIAIGNDHAGTAYKFAIVAALEKMGYNVLNFGTDSDDSVDYPDHIHPVASAVSAQEAALGIIICGSGNGAAMTANKYQDIRAALCWNKEIVALAKQHNNANILSLPARYLSLPQALEMVQVYLETAFEGGRHANRVEKIACS